MRQFFRISGFGLGENLNFYLRTGYYYWTMSVCYFSLDDLAAPEWHMNDYAKIGGLCEITDGTGTTNNPFIVNDL